MKKITKKSKRMKEVEENFGEELEELLRRKYVDEDKVIKELQKELSQNLEKTISFRKIIEWLNKAGIYSKELKSLK